MDCRTHACQQSMLLVMLFAHQNEHKHQLLAAFDAKYAYVEECS